MTTITLRGYRFVEYPQDYLFSAEWWSDWGSHPGVPDPDELGEEDEQGIRTYGSADIQTILDAGEVDPIVEDLDFYEIRITLPNNGQIIQLESMPDLGVGVSFTDSHISDNYLGATISQNEPYMVFVNGRNVGRDFFEETNFYLFTSNRINYLLYEQGDWKNVIPISGFDLSEEGIVRHMQNSFTDDNINPVAWAHFSGFLPSFPDSSVRQSDIVRGNRNDDLFNTGLGNDKVQGKGGNDSIWGGGGQDRLFGGNGQDYLRGGLGNDLISGGNGADILFGDTGNDVLKGGAGNDRFVFNRKSGNDTIRDFNSDADQIEILNGARNLRDLTLTQRGDDVVVTFARTTILIEDTTLSEVNDPDIFVF